MVQIRWNAHQICLKNPTHIIDTLGRPEGFVNLCVDDIVYTAQNTTDQPRRKP
jgi:hypothetical protein